MDTAFLMYLALVVAVVAVVIARNLATRYARAVLAGLGLWLAYGGILGYCGVVGDRTLFPPGPAFLVLPVFLFVALVVTRTDAVQRVALSIPLSLLLGLQVFRVGVEVVLHQLCCSGSRLKQYCLIEPLPRRQAGAGNTSVPKHLVKAAHRASRCLWDEFRNNRVRDSASF